MALTATATKEVRMDVSRITGMRNEFIVAKPPSKPNTMYTVVTFSVVEETFLPIAKKVQEERLRCPRMITYCRNYRDCADLYLFSKGYPGVNFTEPPGSPELPRFRLVDMYELYRPSR